MNIVDVLDKELIKVPLESHGSYEVIEELVGVLEKALSLTAAQKEEIARAVHVREAMGSTALGHGVAIPHAKVSAIRKVTMVVGIAAEPIPFGASDGESVSVFFLVLAPPDALSSHVEILSSLARSCSSPALLGQLKKARNATQVYSIFKD